jgi:hypothetical protein
MWQRGVKVASSPSYVDPNQYLPKFAKERMNDFLSAASFKSSWKKITQIVRSKKPFMASMIVYGVHQCCGHDKFKCCQMLLDLIQSDEVRKRIVNTPYGRKGYTPLHRACYNGSERMLKFMICCGADVNVVSPEGETLLQVLQQGLDQQEKDAQYTLAKILSYSPRSQFYKVCMPNGETNEFSSTLVDHRKWVKKGYVYVHTPARKDDFIFIKERFRNCKKYIRGKQAFDEKQKNTKKKKRLLLKSHAVRIVQRWWRGHRGKKREESSVQRRRRFTWEKFLEGEPICVDVDRDGAKVFLLQLIQKGRMNHIHQVLDTLATMKKETVYHQLLNEDEDIRGYAMDDCPTLLKLK